MSDNLQHKGMLSRSLKVNSSWKLACYSLAAVVVFLGWKMVEVKSSQTVAIVPYGLYSANKEVRIGSSLEESRDYIELLFRSDLTTLLTWQAANVSKQFGTFMTRLSHEGYEAYNLDLRNKADKYGSENLSQVFHTTSMKLLSHGQIGEFVMEAEGRLVRMRGGEVIIDTDVVYRFAYRQKATGLFAIDKIDTSYERAAVQEN